MSRRARIVLCCAVLGLLALAPPAAAEECVEVEVLQFKHCVPV